MKDEKVLNSIQEVLNTIEKKENIKIIYACESGSRAWGFHSENSDYDVRFIYIRPILDYFTVSTFREVLDRNKGNISTSEYLRSLEKFDLDFCGVDIPKVMGLISKGNSMLSEWLNSPIVYKEDIKYTDIIKQISKEYFKYKASIYHYEHMASKNFIQYIKNVEGDVLLKKYLYVLRPLYACEYIKLYKEYPPIEFEVLYNDKGILDNEIYNKLYPIVISLVDKKKKGEELGRGSHIPELDVCCEILLKDYHNYANDIKAYSLTKEDFNKIDYFYRILMDAK